MTGSRCNPTLILSRPWSSHDDGVQVYLRNSWITVFKFTHWSSPSVSLSSLKPTLQVNLKSRSIVVSKCISEYARVQPPSWSIGLFNPWHSGYFYSHSNHWLQLPIPVHSMLDSKYIFKLTQSQLPRISQFTSLPSWGALQIVLASTI